MPERLSAVIITRDAATLLPECLQSVRFADEILIVDSGSQDATRAIAKRHGARFLHQDWLAYDMPRCNRFMGRWLRHGEGYPDPNLRLFHRSHAHWSDDPIHEHVVTTEPVGRLDGDLLHDTATSLADYLDKQNRYTTLQAERLHAQGKRVGAARLLLSPLARFIKFYFLRRGFLDGVPGLVHIAIGCFNSFMKYAKLMQLTRSAKK